jgi:hypothetical protein
MREDEDAEYRQQSASGAPSSRDYTGSSHRIQERISVEKIHVN